MTVVAPPPALRRRTVRRTAAATMLVASCGPLALAAWASLFVRDVSGSEHWLREGTAATLPVVGPMVLALWTLGLVSALVLERLQRVPAVVAGLVAGAVGAVAGVGLLGLGVLARLSGSA